jgi:hypothetical protein
MRLSSSASSLSINLLLGLIIWLRIRDYVVFKSDARLLGVLGNCGLIGCSCTFSGLTTEAKGERIDLIRPINIILILCV